MQTALFIHIFCSKGFEIFLQRMLEFPSLCMMWHLVGVRESSYVG